MGPPPTRALAAATGSGALSSLAGIGLLATSGWLITRASQRPPVLDLAIAVGMVQAFALARGVARYAERLEVHGVSLAILSRLRLWLFDTVEPLVPARLPVHREGAVLHGFVADTETVTEAVARATATVTETTAAIATGTALAWLLVPAAGAVMLGATVLMVALSWLAARVGGRAARSAGEARADLASSIIETVRSAPELAAFGRADLTAERLERIRRRALESALRQAAATGAARLLATWAAGAGLIGVATAGLQAHAQGRLSGVWLAVLLLAALAVLDSCAGLPAALAALATGDGAARRLLRLGSVLPAAREPGQDRSPAPGPVGAELRRVEVDGPAGAAAPILRETSLRVEPGQRVCLVGPSGCGKTSALRVLLHLLEPSRGLATIGGVNVAEMTRSGIARHAAWLDEDVHVFAASLGSNLRLARPGASDEECLEVLTRVGLADWCTALPGGLSTRLGAQGRPVSAGERQRLGMARALLSGASLLMLDEPSSHLDAVTGPEVLGELFDAAGSRSIVLASHEPELAGRFDAVVLMEPG
ncbi:MAG TPA: thiol reductant ABC exporter subunit CydC [Candidatus Binatia bacterium]|nr:thiol reductant ABC exporter subunit CydC [Candidatus Binatia bacterium]